MSPEQVRAIAILLGEALVSGVRFTEIMQQVEENGDITKEMWDDIRADVKRAEQRWDEADN